MTQKEVYSPVTMPVAKHYAVLVFTQNTYNTRDSKSSMANPDVWQPVKYYWFPTKADLEEWVDANRARTFQVLDVQPIRHETKTTIEF